MALAQNANSENSNVPGSHGCTQEMMDDENGSMMGSSGATKKSMM